MIEKLDTIFEHEDLTKTRPYDLSLKGDDVFKELIKQIKRITYGTSPVTSLFKGVKFMLVEINGEGYLRTGDSGLPHRDILSQFQGEPYETRGGGSLEASLTMGQEGFYCTNLTFFGESSEKGPFDKELLRTTLDNNLDKRIEYRMDTSRMGF
jgi:hypothetical protein